MTLWKGENAQSTEVYQLNDSTFYHRGEQWVDSRLVDEGRNVRIDRVVEIGTPEFIELAEELAKEGRASSLAVQGDLLVEVNKERVLATASKERATTERARMMEMRRASEAAK